MTEAEWLNEHCHDFHQMWLALDGLRRAMSITAQRRKPRLFACACCRRIWNWLDEPDGAAIEIAERYADGLAKYSELSAVGLRSPPVDAALNLHPESVANRVCELVYQNAATQSGDTEQGRIEARQERIQQVKLLREMFGNPFRSPELDAPLLGWNDQTVPKIAAAIYDERAFDRMPILADALEDAGCDDADILRHCREPGQHVRGCWVIDLLLGKE